jgi:hypothetical protein
MVYGYTEPPAPYVEPNYGYTGTGYEGEAPVGSEGEFPPPPPPVYQTPMHGASSGYREQGYGGNY